MKLRSLLSFSAAWTALVPIAIGSFAACSSSGDAASGAAADAGPSQDGAASSDAATTADASSTDVACPRKRGTADHPRKVIVSHPNDADAGKVKDYEVLDLGLDGNLTRGGQRFTMGHNFDAPILFSPDGVIGVAVQDDDGTLGIFRFDPGNATPIVVAAQFGKDLFYADWAVFSPDGARLYVADSNRNPGGGIHEVAIACDGTPTYRGQVLDAQGSGALSLVPGTSRALVAAATGPSAPKGHDAFLVDLAANGGAMSVASSVALFGDDQLSPHGVAVTPDGKIGFVPDGNDVYGTNRLGVLGIADGVLKKIDVIDLPSPSGVVVSPFGNAALVTAAGGPSVDAVHLVRIESNGTVTVTGKVAMTPKPQLPTGPVVIDSGPQKGLVLMSEVDGIRRVQFDASGTVKDLGLFAFPGGLEASIGSVGVQP